MHTQWVVLRERQKAIDNSNQTTAQVFKVTTLVANSSLYLPLSL